MRFNVPPWLPSACLALMMISAVLAVLWINLS